MSWLRSRKLVAFTGSSALVVLGGLLAGKLGLSEGTYGHLVDGLVWLFGLYATGNVGAKAANRLPVGKEQASGQE